MIKIYELDDEELEKLSPEFVKIKRAVDVFAHASGYKENEDYHVRAISKRCMASIFLLKYNVYLYKRTFSDQLKYLIDCMEQKEIPFNKENLIEEALKQTGE